MTNGSLLLTIITTLYIAFILKPVIYKMQSGGYKLNALFTDSKFFLKCYSPYLLTGVIFTALYHLGLLFDDKAFYIVLAALYFVILGFLVYRNYEIKFKKPFVMTPRAGRLYVVIIILYISIIIHCIIKIETVNEQFGGIVAYFSPIILPLISWLGQLLLHPFEKLNNKRYILRAENILNSNNNLIKIGITGSFGKTSVKNILTSMLETKYNVVSTEGNFNTPLGIAKSANNITPETEVFVAEMGARKTGDIDELVKIVKPKYGILTGVTKQHLETFKNINNIYEEKFKLINFLPSDGLGIVNVNGIARDIPIPNNAILVGDESCSCFCRDIVLNNEGASFKLVLHGKEYKAKTKLLGEHNLQNITSAAYLAYELGVPAECIINTIRSLPHTPHRLQLIKNGDLTIIDDTYNANPVGVEEALKVLKDFSGRKIIVTPGMVELGSQEENENIIFGKKIADVADIVILIGIARANYIRKGLSEKNFSEYNILNYRTLELAENDFPKIFSQGDIILFINDLPDNYNE